MGRKRSNDASKIASSGDLPCFALGFEGEVDDHDRVLLDDADEQDDADDPDHVEVLAGDHQREQRPDAGRGQRRKNCHRMNEAFVQHAQHDVDGDKRRDQQEHLARKGILESLRRTLEAARDRRRQMHRPNRLIDFVDRRAERRVLSQIERYGDRGKLRQMADHERRLPGFDVGDGGKRHLARGGRLGRQIERPQGFQVGQAIALGHEDHAVLRRLVEDRRDDALAERVVKRVVDRRRGDAVARGKLLD